jgi:hypothetical protein
MSETNEATRYILKGSKECSDRAEAECVPVGRPPDWVDVPFLQILGLAEVACA